MHVVFCFLPHPGHHQPAAHHLRGGRFLSQPLPDIEQDAAGQAHGGPRWGARQKGIVLNHPGEAGMPCCPWGCPLQAWGGSGPTWEECGGAGEPRAFPVSCSVDKWGLSRFLKDQGLAKDGEPGWAKRWRWAWAWGVGKCAEPRRNWLRGLGGGESGEGVKPGT